MTQKQIEFNPDIWYSTPEVLQLAQRGYAPFKSASTLYRLIDTGKIKVVIRGDARRRKYYIQGRELQNYGENQKVTINKDGKQMQEGSSKADKKKDLGNTSRKR